MLGLKGVPDVDIKILVATIKKIELKEVIFRK